LSFTDAQQQFLRSNHSAAMITLRPDGTPHVARVGVGLVDGQLWSSGVPSRLRTSHLRRDARCTLFVFDTRYSWLGLETTVTIVDGPEAPEMHVRLFTEMQQGMDRPDGTLLWNGQPLSLDQFRQTMRDEQRLIYAFDEPRRVYGLGV
jgi:PPOX class probable F420-dependent enzyme